MSRLSLAGAPLPSMSQDKDTSDSGFETELYSFLAELSKTSDMSSLEQSLSRLKVAMQEEVTKTDNMQEEVTKTDNIQDGAEDSDTSSSMAGPETAPKRSSSPEMTTMDLSSSCSTSPAPGDTSSSTNISTDNSLSSSPPLSAASTSVGAGRGDSTRLDSRTSRRFMFSVQSGARFDLKEEEVRQVFSQYGHLVRFNLFHKTRMGLDGFLEFSSGLATSSLENSLVRVGDCQIHCSLPWDTLTNQPVPYQILLESRYLPHVWERDMILRSFFSKYGVVTGVSMIGYTSGKLLRYVISFKDPNPAMDLIGSHVKILSSTVWVREVTRETIQASPVPRERAAASRLPWRK